ncbi:hypothetical protein SEUCBS139899_008086 [Sporothrix eucalyptigena]|uniref:Uncharacterized protein n=1 Tax=Sporothrix eucalyptigena TaxID=1812306 RepID=A0ABP0CGU4_9PEZI
MGQNCCKPCGGPQWKRLARVKAEAAAAAEASSHPSNLPQPDPTVAQLLVSCNNNNQTHATVTTATSTTDPGINLPSLSVAPCGPPQPDGPSDVRIVIETEEDDEHARPLPDQLALPRRRLRKDTREWLHRQRRLLAKARKLGRRHRNKKQKVALAHDEAPTPGRHPIVTIEASSDDSNASQGPLLVSEDRMTESPELLSSNFSGRPGPQLLEPIPRRPLGPRFPFLNPGTVSIATTRSSNESHPSMTPSTVIALRRTVIEDGLDDQQTGHRTSIQSNSPSIYYLAPTSPEMPAAETMSIDERLASSSTPVAFRVAPVASQPKDSLSAEVTQTNAEEPFLNTLMSYVTSSWQRPWSVSPA